MNTNIHILDRNLGRQEEIQNTSLSKTINDTCNGYATQVHSLIGIDLHTEGDGSFDFSEKESSKFNPATEQLIAKKLAETLKVLGIMTPQSRKKFDEIQRKENKGILSMADVLRDAESSWGVNHNDFLLAA